MAKLLYEIGNHPKPPVEPPLPTVTLSLNAAEGGVDLHATDEDGYEWLLMRFESDGRVLLFADVPADLGLNTDDNGLLVFDA